jgi:hypothetical protein
MYRDLCRWLQELLDVSLTTSVQPLRPVPTFENLTRSRLLLYDTLAVILYDSYHVINLISNALLDTLLLYKITL